MDVVEGGKELVVRRVELGDRGEYSCTLNHKYNPVTQHHTLDILGTVENTAVLSTTSTIQSLSTTHSIY
jgi:hypothetical protein